MNDCQDFIGVVDSQTMLFNDGAHYYDVSDWYVCGQLLMQLQMLSSC